MFFIGKLKNKRSIIIIRIKIKIANLKIKSQEIIFKLAIFKSSNLIFFQIKLTNDDSI